jgi:putative glutamine amidotransferase
MNINSAHHQAIDSPGDVFRVVARTEDGVVELIEHPDESYFATGIQSHPEVFKDSPLDPLFESFALECQRYLADS